jgi:hypothetical protein
MLLVGSPEGRRPLRGTKCSRVKNIKMDLEETGWAVWPGKGPCKCGYEASGCITCGKFLSGNTNGGLLCRAQFHKVCEHFEVQL